MNKLLSHLAGFCLLVGILLNVIDFTCFFLPFYEYEYHRDHQAEYIGMSEDDLMLATETLLDYLKGYREDIVVEAEVNGYVREVYDERETLHMVDVKNLYQKAMKVRWGLMWLALSIYFYYYFNHKKQFFSFFKESFQQGCILLSVVVAFVAIWAILDFNSFWMNFHYVFFDNDLFLLDPNISIMINMFPERFFFDMVAMIIITFLFVVAIMYLIIHYLYRREVNRFVEEV